DHLPAPRLSRLRHHDREPDRPAALPQRLRPAAAADPPHRLPAPLAQRQAGRERARIFRSHGRRPRDADPGGRAGHRRRLHGWTYSAHPICAAAANANLDIVDREDLTGNARTTGGYFQKRLHETFDDHPLVGEVRGVGLLAALEFAADKATKAPFDPAKKVGPKVSAACLDEGMIARAMPHGDILGFAPPLVITPAEVDQVVDMAKRAVDRVCASL